MPKYYIESGKLKTIIEGKYAKDAVIKAVKIFIDKDPGYELEEKIAVNEIGFVFDKFLNHGEIEIIEEIEPKKVDLCKMPLLYLFKTNEIIEEIGNEIFEELDKEIKDIFYIIKNKKKNNYLQNISFTRKGNSIVRYTTFLESAMQFSEETKAEAFLERFKDIFESSDLEIDKVK